MPTMPSIPTLPSLPEEPGFWDKVTKDGAKAADRAQDYYKKGDDAYDRANKLYDEGSRAADRAKDLYNDRDKLVDRAKDLYEHRDEKLAKAKQAWDHAKNGKYEEALSDLEGGLGLDDGASQPREDLGGVGEDPADYSLKEEEEAGDPGMAGSDEEATAVILVCRNLLNTIDTRPSGYCWFSA